MYDFVEGFLTFIVFHFRFIPILLKSSTRLNNTMKKIVLIVLLSVTICSIELYGQGYGIGAKVGPNVSTLLSNSDDLEYWTPLVGGHVGGYGYYMFSKKVGLELGLMYTTAGFIVDDSDYSKEDIRLSYFAVPVSPRFKFGYFTLNPGIQFGILLSAKDENGKDLSDAFAETDVSVFLTPGIELPMGLRVSTALNFGLTGLLVELDEKNSNFVFQLSIGYTFLKNKED